MARVNFFVLLVLLSALILGCIAQCQPADCDDNNACTVDKCIDNKCVHESADNGTSCDDDIWCNGKDVCSSGICQHLGDPCARGPVCSNVCHEESTSCISSLGTSCDDGLFCNGKDTCDGAGHCLSSGNPCSSRGECNDQCNESNQSCLAQEGTSCTAGMQCEQLEASCHTGKCIVTRSVNCTVLSEEIASEEKGSSSSNSGLRSDQVAIIAGSVGGGLLALILVSVVLGLIIIRRRRATAEIKIDMEANRDDYDSGKSSAVSVLPPTGGLPGNIRMMLTPAESVNGSPLAVRRAVAYSSTTADRVRMETSARSIEEMEIGKPLGTGNFGEVFFAVWNKPLEYNETMAVQVAVKKLRRSGRFENFRGEVETLRHLGHTNIVQYYGVFADHNNHDMYLATEYMKMGSLVDLLQILGDKISEQQMVEMCLDAVMGMAYLERSHIVHRDLSCRNLLVSTDENGRYVVKVGDFGNAKCMTGDSYVGDDAIIPVRWSAVEVLRENTFSHKSDVWAFGVCMWEIFEKGKEPYADCSDFQVSEWILRGDRLEKPKDCADDLYDVMSACWQENPADRPNFHSIIDLICHVLEDRKSADNEEDEDSNIEEEDSEEETAAGRLHAGRQVEEEEDVETL